VKLVYSLVFRGKALGKQAPNHWCPLCVGAYANVRGKMGGRRSKMRGKKLSVGFEHKIASMRLTCHHQAMLHLVFVVYQYLYKRH